jgi:hypothetical protein
VRAILPDHGFIDQIRTEGMDVGHADKHRVVLVRAEDIIAPRIDLRQNVGEMVLVLARRVRRIG